MAMDASPAAMNLSHARARLESIGDVRLEQTLLQESKELLRVVSSRHIFASNGSVLKSSDGSQETYDLSRPAQSIPWFISHSWRTGRWTKTLALAVYLHMRLAFICSVACLVASFIALLLTSRADLCTAADFDTWLGDVLRASVVPVLPAAAFAAVAYYGHLLPVSGGRTDCFLDKICIHQKTGSWNMSGILWGFR